MKKHFLSILLLTVCLKLSATVFLRYTFDTLPNGVSLHNGTQIVEMKDGNSVLSTGYDNGYANLGATFGSDVIAKLNGDFTISIDLYVDDVDNNLTQDGNFVWCFASQESNGNPANYMMMRVKNGALGYTMRYGRSNYRLETSAKLTTGAWQNVTYVRDGNTARLYLNGVQISEKTYAADGESVGEHYYSPVEMYEQAGSLSYCWLARSAWSGDAYLNGALLDNFIIEDRAYSAQEIADNYAITTAFSTQMKEEYVVPDPTDELDYYNAEDVRTLIENINDAYQKAHPYNRRSFWDYAVYHTGNMAAWRVTGKRDYLEYSMNWGNYNNWYGSIGDDPSQWKYGYGEGSNYALFGDWQCCFQTYIDIYNDTEGELSEEQRGVFVARANQVMDYMMRSDTIDYWWWADALYMAMPVMTKMWKLTGDEGYLNKLDDCFQYSKNLMYSEEDDLFFRDANYIYPQHKTTNGKPDFWSRGNGWVVAGLAKTLADMPEGNTHRDTYARVYNKMCSAIVPCQHAEGFWTESLKDSLYARCRESSGTCLFTFGLLWGINNGLLSESEYWPTVERAWNYLTEIALQRNWTVGYMQPIGAAANENAVLYPSNVTNFGTGAFLLAASEMLRYLENKSQDAVALPLNTLQSSDKVYSVSGQRLLRLKKGVNIVGNRKILVP